MKTKMFLVSLLVLVFLAGSFVSAMCAYPESVESTFNKSSAVFQGELIDITEFVNAQYGWTGYIYNFEVLKKYKGDLSDQVSLNYTCDAFPCGIAFEEDTEYLIYAYGEIDQLEVSGCGRTKQASYAAEEIEELERLSDEDLTNCIDSDGGIAFGVGGVVSSSQGNQWADSCSLQNNGTQGVLTCSGISCFVSEHSCNSFTDASKTFDGVYYTLKNCPNGCSNGACLGEASNETICYDSDGGIDYFIQGYVSTNYNGQNSSYRVFDACMLSDFEDANQSHGVDSCSGSNCKLQDFYCDGNVGSYGSFYDCPLGCLNGACIQSNTTTTPTQSNTTTTPTNQTGCSKDLKICPDGSGVGRDPTNNCEFFFCQETNDSINCGSGFCSSGNKCYPFGYRKSGEYCSDSGNFVEQFTEDNVCENNFECSSNVCVSSKCVSASLLDKILNWFKHLF